jgi:putative peptidoglycan lipid II flippase
MTPQSRPRKGLGAAAASIGGATMISRVTGLLRDIMIAAALGAGPLADIFVVAFRLPNLFRRLFAEGAFSAAFVPLYARRLEAEGEASARQFAAKVLAVLLAALLLFTALAQIFMPALVVAIAQGFTQDPAQFDLAVYHARITFPYLVFMSLLAFYAALLNARGVFFAPAFAPVLLNLVLIASLALAAVLGAMPLGYLIWGVALAGVVQLLWVVIAAARRGITIPLIRPQLDGDVRKLWRLAVPGILAAGIGQINLLVGTSIATAQSGAAAWLYYADRLYQLPMGVIGVALGVALLPSLSRDLAAGDDRQARASQSQAVFIAMMLTIPASVGLAVLAEPLVQLFFERGAFAIADRSATALAVRAFCLGLPAFVLIKIVQPAFFAREDTRSPLVDGACGVVLNIGLSLALFDSLGHLAIAIATSAAGWLTLVLMIIRIYARGYWRFELTLARHLVGQVVAALGMALALYAAQSYLVTPIGLGALLLYVLALVGLGAGVYAVLAMLFGGLRLGDLRRLR